MASRTKEIGLIGEQVIIAEFIKCGFTVLVPLGDNNSYDIVIERNGSFKKIQVKTCEKQEKGMMKFCTNVSNPFKRKNRKYNKDEVDYFGLYCIQNGYIGLLPVEECTSKETRLRTTMPLNKQVSKIKMADKYKFESMIDKI